MGDAEKPIAARRWNDVPGTFEWRLLQLEQQRQDQEVRLRTVESSMSALGQQLTDVKNSVEEVRKNTSQSNAAQNRNLVTSIITIIAVILTFIFSHLPAGAAH